MSGRNQRDIFMQTFQAHSGNHSIKSSLSTPKGSVSGAMRETKLQFKAPMLEEIISRGVISVGSRHQERRDDISSRGSKKSARKHTAESRQPLFQESSPRRYYLGSQGQSRSQINPERYFTAGDSYHNSVPEQFTRQSRLLELPLMKKFVPTKAEVQQRTSK